MSDIPMGEGKSKGDVKVETPKFDIKSFPESQSLDVGENFEGEGDGKVEKDEDGKDDIKTFDQTTDQTTDQNTCVEFKIWHPAQTDSRFIFCTLVTCTFQDSSINIGRASYSSHSGQTTQLKFQIATSLMNHAQGAPVEFRRSVLIYERNQFSSKLPPPFASYILSKTILPFQSSFVNGHFYFNMASNVGHTIFSHQSTFVVSLHHDFQEELDFIVDDNMMWTFDIFVLRIKTGTHDICDGMEKNCSFSPHIDCGLAMYHLQVVDVRPNITSFPDYDILANGNLVHCFFFEPFFKVEQLVLPVDSQELNHVSLLLCPAQCCFLGHYFCEPSSQNVKLFAKRQENKECPINSQRHHLNNDMFSVEGLGPNYDMEPPDPFIEKNLIYGLHEISSTIYRKFLVLPRYKVKYPCPNYFDFDSCWYHHKMQVVMYLMKGRWRFFKLFHPMISANVFALGLL